MLDTLCQQGCQLALMAGREVLTQHAPLAPGAQALDCGDDDELVGTLCLLWMVQDSSFVSIWFLCPIGEGVGRTSGQAF